MTFPRLLVAVFSLFFGGTTIASAQSPVQTPAQAPAVPPETMSPLLLFYVAKGGPDSCGPGCDSWIAVEGKVDDEAASRLRTFLRQHKDRKLPLYFHSPGGNLTQALAMGRMLRREKVVGRVARTVLKDCAAGPQIDEDCLKLKRSGRELGATLAARGAMCNSACPLVLFGAVMREVAPDVALGIHSPRVTLKILRGRLSEKARAEASRQAVERADRLIARYLAEMGIDHRLLDLQRTIKFEDRHLLTRDEIFRFGIDRREFVETSWFLEPGIRSSLRKLAMEKQEGKTAFRILQWRLSCITASDFRLDYQRQVDGSGTFGSVSLSGGDLKALQFRFPPFKSAGYETWQLRMTRDSVQSFAGLPQLDVTETSTGPDGQRSVHLGKLSTEGLAASIRNLLGSCTVPTIGNDWWRAATELKKQGLAPTQEPAPRQEAAPRQEPAAKDTPADK